MNKPFIFAEWRWRNPNNISDSCSVGETIRGASRTRSKYQGCSLDDEDDWHQLKNGICVYLPFMNVFVINFELV